MPLIKDSHKLFEFKAYFSHPTKAFSHLIDIFAVFSGKQLIQGVFALKSKGIPQSNLLETLVFMPFLGASNVRSLFSQLYSVFYEGKKDCLYDALRDPQTDWRKLLLNFGKCFILKTRSSSPKIRLSFFIADDTDLEKSTPYFEGISRVYNHVTKTYPIGYKALVLGYSDGASFVPLDFSLHNEKGKKKNFGLTPEQRKSQFSKERDAASCGAKRLKELRAEKGENLIKMVRRAVKRGITADYLLTDSWFLSENMLKEIRRIKDGAIQVLSMCKMDKRGYQTASGKLTASELLAKSKSNAKRSKKYRATYCEHIVEYKDIKVKLFLIRLSKRAKWRLLVTTDTSMQFTEAYDLYANRWSIEVFFKECKQLLGLGRNQSRDFDAQIASATLSFIQYTILALHKRYDAYETIGGLFASSKAAVTEQVFSDRIRAMIIELIEFLFDSLNIDADWELSVSALIEKTDLGCKIEHLISTSPNIGGNMNVA